MLISSRLPAMRKTDSILIDAQMTRISDKHLNGNIWNKCSNQSWNCYCTKLQHTIISDKHLYILAPRYTPLQALYGHPGGAITLVYLAHWAQDFLDQPRPLDQWKDSGRTFERRSYMLDETCIDACWLDIFQTFDVPLRFSSAQSTPSNWPVEAEWVYIYKSLIYAGNTSLGRLMFPVKEGFPQLNQSFRPAGNLHFCS